MTAKLRDEMIKLGWKTAAEIEQVDTVHASSLYVKQGASSSLRGAPALISEALRLEFEARLAQLGLKLDDEG